MSKFAFSVLVRATSPVPLTAAPAPPPAHAAGEDNPAPPASGSKKDKKKDKSSGIDDGRFIEGYRAAYLTIYDRNDYASAIAQLKALGQDDRADVANLIGYSYRKLGIGRGSCR